MRLDDVNDTNTIPQRVPGDNADPIVQWDHSLCDCRELANVQRIEARNARTLAEADWLKQKAEALGFVVTKLAQGFEWLRDIAKEAWAEYEEDVKRKLHAGRPKA